DQVKIRGLRIELGEIEAALLACDQVGNAVVRVHTDAAGQRLIAYVVAAEMSGTTHILDQVQQRLPAYMVPSSVIRIDEIPLTAPGKVDYRALPEPVSGDLESEYREPQGLVEQAVADVFAELLDVTGVGADDNFFDLGGNSLLATRALSR